MLGQLLETLSGHWAVHLESRVPRTELYEARIASSKPSLGFFILLLSSVVIDSIGPISHHVCQGLLDDWHFQAQKLHGELTEIGLTSFWQVVEINF